MAGTLDQLHAALAHRYAFEQEIGRGGMATVHLARDLRHQRQVAIKVLRPDISALLGPERFHREITVCAAAGQADQAFGLLERAIVAREPWLVFLKVDPIFDNVRDDPRFDSFVDRIGIPR